jgi:transcriptional regulator with XRE-family HTH domain
VEANNGKCNNLGRNIRSLRNAYGQSLLDLALDIGVGVSAISQYENGKRIPERDILIKIAKHFKVTENELLYGDYSNLKDLTSAPVNNKAYNIATIDKLLPILHSEEAEKNGDFAKACELHLQLYEHLMQNAIVDEAQVDACITLYEAASKSGVREATANILWWMMLFGVVLSYINPRLIACIETLRGKETTMKEVIGAYLYSPEDEEDESYIEIQKERADFIKENEVDLLLNIALLKNSEKYSALGDYYLALCYIFSLRNNDMSSEMNSSIGYEMMHIFRVLGNPYAQAFLSPISTETAE